MFWLNDILVSTTTQRDGSYQLTKLNNLLALFQQHTKLKSDRPFNFKNEEKRIQKWNYVLQDPGIDSRQEQAIFLFS